MTTPPNDWSAEDCRTEFDRLEAVTSQLMNEAAPEQLMRLNRTIQGEIIPRLMMAFAPDAPADEMVGEQAAPADIDLHSHVEPFVDLLLTEDASVAVDYVTALRARGAPLAQVYLSLLAPAARRLGKLWESDRCTFTEVTLGCCRMHQVLLQFSPCFRADRPENEDGHHCAVVLPVPGEQHTFGLFMVIEFFRRAGWDVWSIAADNNAQLEALLRDQRFDVIGLSLSAERHEERLHRSIAMIRRCAQNPNVKIMLGGRMVTEDPAVAERFDVDGVASDAHTAVKVATGLVDGLN